MQDPKRKVHKPVKGVLRLEIEKHRNGHGDFEDLSENGSIINDSLDLTDRLGDLTLMKCPSSGSAGPRSSGSKWNTEEAKDVSRSLASSSVNLDNCYYVSVSALSFSLLFLDLLFKVSLLL